MKLIGNTILITGGGSGIGRGLAEALHHRGNQIVIAGRRQAALERVAAGCPGMQTLELDVADPASIARAAQAVVSRFPSLNVLVNNAGIQRLDRPDGVMSEEVLLETVATNLLGPIRLTSALLEHLKRQPGATVLHVTSMLGFLPLAEVSIYSATKAALHSYALSQRHRLRGTTVEVLELVPPYVQTGLLNGATDPRAMPLAQFVAEAMEALASGAPELLVPRAKARRDALRVDELQPMQAFNDLMGKV